MSNTLTTEKVVAAYSLLRTASLKGMDTLGKFAVIKVTKGLKGFATDFEDFKQDVIERLKDEKFEEIQAKSLKWEEQSNEERIAINVYLKKFDQMVHDCLKEEAQKEICVDFKGLSEKQFEALIGANDNWTVEQILLLEDVVIA